MRKANLVNLKPLMRWPVGRSRPTSYVDITDLLEYYHISPVGTGIQRVLVETIRYLSSNNSHEDEATFVFFDFDRKWKIIPHHLVRAMLARAAAGDKGWKTAYPKMFADFQNGQAVYFSNEDVLYFLGAPWSNFGIIESIIAMGTKGPRCVYYIHDVIPLKHPEYFVPEHEKVFSYWVRQLRHLAQAVICNSQATQQDFIDITGYTGLTTVADLAIMPKNMQSNDATFEATVLKELGLAGKRFVLMVGTIEPRKNHIAVANVWNDLSKRFGDDCPILVVAGTVGWKAEGIVQHFEIMNRSGKIKLVGAQNDQRLATLYRHCEFTIYVSRYEGWGLPVTESLAFGKACISADNTSLPEAGQSLSHLVNHRNEASIEAQAIKLISEPKFRAATEAEIARKLKLKTWQDFFHEVCSVEPKLPSIPRFSVPQIQRNTPYWIGRGKLSNAFAETGAGEILRTGPGWLSLEEWGCWSSARQSALLLTLPDDGVYEIFLHLVPPPGGAKLKISGPNGRIWQGRMVKERLIVGDLGWLEGDAPVRIQVRSDRLAPNPSNNPALKKFPVSVGWVAINIIKRESNDSGAASPAPRNTTLKALSQLLDNAPKATHP